MRSRERWGRLCMRLAAIFLAAGVVLCLPTTAPAESVLRYKDAAAIFFGIVFAGKQLFDTFFYDHFRW